MQRKEKMWTYRKYVSNPTSFNWEEHFSQIVKSADEFPAIFHMFPSIFQTCKQEIKWQ